MCRYRKKQIGFVLLPVMLLLVLLAVINLLISQTAEFRIATNDMDLKNEQARYTIEAGYNHAKQLAVIEGCEGYTTLPGQTFSLNNYELEFSSKSTSSFSHVYSLNPTDDAYIEESNSDHVHGTSNHIRVGMQTDDRVRTMLKFDLSSIPNSEYIYSSIMWIQVKGDNEEVEIELHRITSSWSETVATWDDHADQFDSLVISSIPEQHSDSEWLGFNVTKLTRQWLDGTYSNEGVILIATSGSEDEDYYSREYSGAPPRLEIITGDSRNASVDATITTPYQDLNIIKSKKLAVYPDHSIRKIIKLDSSISDATIKNSGNSDRNYGITSTLEVDNAGSDSFRSLIKFDANILNAMRDSAELTSVKLSLYLTGGTLNSPADLSLNKLSRSWIEGTGSYTLDDPGVTFDSYEKDKDWLSVGGDYESEPVDTINIAIYKRGWYSWEIKDTLLYWKKHPTHNFGFILQAMNGSADGFMFASTDNTNADRHPQLVFEYRCQCGVDCEAQ